MPPGGKRGGEEHHHPSLPELHPALVGAWIHTFRWLSPTILTYEALVELAGTGDERIERFEREVEAFHARWVAHFEPLIHGNRRLAPEDLDRLPTWGFREGGSGQLRAAVLPGLLGLLLFAGIALAAALGLRRDGGDRRWTPQ